MYQNLTDSDQYLNFHHHFQTRLFNLYKTKKKKSVYKYSHSNHFYKKGSHCQGQIVDAFLLINLKLL
jgi:hypothetical protein